MRSFLLFFMLIGSTVSAQNIFSFGIRAGLNKSDLIGDGFKKLEKKGFNGGFIFQLKIAKNFSGQLNTLFSNKGCAYNWSSPDITVTRYFVRLYYLEFPVLLLFHYKKMMFEAGPGAGYLLDQGEYLPNRGFHDIIHPFKEKEVTMNAGMHYKVYENVGLNLLYTVSALPVRNLPVRQYNSVVTLTLDLVIPLKKEKA